MRDRVRRYASLQSDPQQALAFPPSRAITLAQTATRAGGESLGQSVRSDMEQRFGHSFGHVRVHADDRAAASADLLDAPAYAMGSDIVFGREQYLPESDDGQALLAHELAHVVQDDLGALKESAALDSGPSDPSERHAEHMAHAATSESHEHEHHHDGPCECPHCRAARGMAPLSGTEGESCGCSGTHEESHSDGDQAAPVANAAASVHRAPFEKHRDTGSSAGHTAGDDYQGPSGTVTKQGKDSASLFGNVPLGGAVSYGCYCGPGGDPETGSRCGKGAPAVDEIDEQCRQHDTNYGLRGVDSGDVPGKANMWSLEGWLNTSDADRQLADSVSQAMATHPGDYSPSARLYGQGIKGIFGARSRGAEGYKWGADRVNDVESGVTSAYNDASSFLGDTYTTGSNLLGSDLAGAQSFATNALGRAGTGVSDFLSSASSWNSVGDVASGVGGGMMDALSFVGNTEAEGLGRAGNALLDFTGFAGSTAQRAQSGLQDATSRAQSFGTKTLTDAFTGITSAQRDAEAWKDDTTRAIGGVGLDLAGRGISSLVDTASQLSPRDIAGPISAAPGVTDWLKSLW